MIACRIRCLAGCTLALLVSGLGEAAAAERPSPQIWFHMRGVERNWHGVDGLQGWEKLFFQPDPAWPDSMRHVNVIVLGPVQKLSDDDLSKVVARLQQKHVAIGLEILAQAYMEAVPTCGQNVEGYATHSDAAAIADKIKKAGGEVKYLAMDEPLWFGHYYNGPHACHSTVENIAERVAVNIKEYQKRFPNVEVGELEPIPSIVDQPGWQDDYRRWLVAFEKTVGKKMAFTQIDIDWNQKNWRPALTSTVNFLRAQQVPIGIVYNAPPSGGTMTNEQWLQTAERNYEEIEGPLHIVPDQAIFASWVSQPARSISDASGAGEDYLVRKYSERMR